MAYTIPKIKQRTAQTQSVPAPVLGWNARDAYAEMDIRYASIMTDWWPQPTYVELRKGYVETATGFASNVNTLMPYNPATGSGNLFAAAGSAIYDASSSGAIGAAVVTGLTSDQWQYTNFATSGGQFLLCVNGSDTAKRYNGTSWADFTVSGGFNTANAVNINAHQERIWLIEKSSLSAWYLGTQSISGTASQFDMSGIFTKGGHLLSMVTWTIDGGYGMDDMAAFITSNGQVAIYKGTNPASSSTWSLVGVYNIGEPLGYRCAAKYGGDALIICKNGLLPLSQLLQSTRVSEKSFLSYTIQKAISSATSAYGTNFGWETTLYPAANMLILNVPVDSATNQQQYAMNTLHGAWTNFTNWPANCWAQWNGDLYFGGTNFVAQAWSGYLDGASNIYGDCLQAYSYFGANTATKRFTMARPIFNTSGNPAISFRVNTDFNLQEPTGNLSFTPTPYGQWGTATWGSSIWGGSQNIKKDWQGVSAIGYAAAAHMEASSADSLQWMSTDYVYEAGSII